MFQKKKTYMFILSAVFLFHSFADAQDVKTSDNEVKEKKAYEAKISVTARGYESSLTKTPGSIGIITSDDLQYTQPNSITNALNVVPGVSKSSDSAWGSEMSIRGSSRSNVVFLIDGIRLNTATDVGAQFGTIDPMAVERVEILKGPISSLYGSGTMGGVVNVITRNGYFADEAGFDGGMNVSYNLNSEGVNTYAFTSYNSPLFYAFASGSYRDHGSYRDGDGEKMENSQFSDMQGNVNLGFKIAQVNKIELKTQYYEGKDIGIPGAGSAGFPDTADVTYPETKRMLANLNYTFSPNGNVFKESKLKLSYHGIERNVIVDKIPAPTGNIIKSIEPEAVHRTYGAEWINRLQVSDHVIVAGADAWIRTLESERVRTKLNGETSVDSPLPDSSYLSTGIFAEDDWKISSIFKLNLGGRFDRIQVKNDETNLYETYFANVPPAFVANKVIWEEKDATENSWNAHAGVTVDITDEWAVTLLGARGYRAASLEERYKYISLSGGVETWGNPDLKPEESLFSEAGLHYSGKKFTAGAAGYYNRMENLITTVAVSSTRNELQNVDEAALYGGELEMSLYPVTGLEISGNIAYTRGRDTKNDEDLPSIPPFNGFLRIKVEPGYGFWVNLDSVYNASQKKVPDGTEESDQWSRFDASAGYRFAFGGMNHEIYAAVDNILDKTYSDYLTTSRGYTFNEPGRAYRVGYKMTF